MLVGGIEVASVAVPAISVATVDADGAPDVRTVLMRFFDERGDLTHDPAAIERVSIDLREPVREFRLATENYTELATRSKDNIQRVLQEQHVPVKDVEVTVQGTASQEG